MIFADKLIALRKKAGYSQEELAQQLNVTRQSVSKWEGAQSVPDIEKILQISKLFGVTTDYLLKDEMGEPEYAESEPTALRRVTLEQANAALAQAKVNAPYMAWGTALCVASPVMLLLLGEICQHSQFGLNEKVATGIGLCVLLFLIKGGDWFVDGASALARRFHLPELLIGATVVSIGTTLPEVMVSTMSAVSGHGEIAYGNAIGSVICNSALIAAITIAVRPGKVDPKTLKTPVIFFFIAAAIYCVAAYGFGEFTRPMGFIMLAMFVAYMVANVRQMKNAPAEEHAEEEELIPLSKTLILLVAGAAVIAVGANLLVDNGTLIAQALGVPESVIALTFVALGTSLPELVTAITSLIKGHSDLSVGNVVGANVFNLVLVSGVSVTLAPFTIPQSSTLFGVNSSLVLDLPVMLAVMLIMTVPALVKGKMNRAQGIILLAIYAAFCAIQFTM